MARPGARIVFLQVGLLVGLTAILARAAQLQIVQRGHWQAAGEPRRIATQPLPARRGTVYDRNGTPLAISQEFHHVSIALNEVRDTLALARLMSSRLGVPISRVRRVFRDARYPYFYGPYSASQIEDLRPVTGVHLESVWLRSYPAGGLARALIGGLTPDSGTAISGMERSFDRLLSGISGEAVFLKDGAGRLYRSPGRPRRDPVAGHDLILTLDAELQSIAETGLTDALRDFDAEGGDVVFLDVRSGEVLAVASVEVQGEEMRPGMSAFTAPFEPGSTAKLFTAAGLLRLGRVDSTTTVFGEHGSWKVAGRREPITDAHAEHGNLTLARAIQVSSNIATAKFSLLLRREEQYETLRDFGFGSPTGVESPAEASGRLRHPHLWEEGYSGPNLAIGYELGVTAIQLAAAYGVVANDGILLAPTLVREVRDPLGRPVYRHVPEAVRRVVSPEVASRLRVFLRDAAGDSGTGSQVQLRNFRVLGKTGTARLFEKGRYQPGKYTASFAGIFPADDPQLVVIVKLVNPRGEYGGLTAAPVTRRMLEEALSARQSALGRRLAVQGARLDDPPPTPTEEPTGPVQVAALPLVESVPSFPRATVPDVSGTGVRQAALALHRRGFRVEVRGVGAVQRTRPAAGASLAIGATVTVWAAGGRPR